MVDRDQHTANGVTFMPKPGYMRYFYLIFFSFVWSGCFKMVVRPKEQCPGKSLGTINQDPSVSNSSMLNVDTFQFSFTDSGYIL